MATITHNTTLMANAVRALAMDAVQQANSGHPGAPLGMAEMAVALWGGRLKHNPADPHWPDRDRFVLSNGHASMLLYALLHLTGYALPMSELKQLPPTAQPDPGTPRGGRDTRRGNHHRPAGPGPGQRGGHGAGREAAGRRVQPPRPHRRGPPHLCLPGRWLPDGRHQPRSHRAGRELQAQQAGGAVRRQRHQHRRQGRTLVPRQRGPAFCRDGLAGGRPGRRA
jgi:hypothetical protein